MLSGIRIVDRAHPLNNGMDFNSSKDNLTSRCCDRQKSKVLRPKVPNLSMYAEWSFGSMVEIAIKLLNETEGTTILSHKKDYDCLSRDLVVEIPNETTVKAMVAVANYLIHFEYRHEALYFYHAAIRFCDQLCLGPCKMEHDSLLQIAKIINARKIRLEPGTRVDDDLYPTILQYLMLVYESREASWLF
mmetsp:Transcript_60717/g.106687  ORF Transcript_60717/g.106687 Transcript_60717/m.106687 type:complete len:189 (-) Transcript_60717:127-693(-)